MASWLQSKNRKLLAAAVAGQAGDVEKLLASGAKLEYADPNGATPLLLAAWHGHADVVDKLLRAGANLHHENARKCTPLVLAAWRGYSRIVAALLKAGARVDHTNSFRETALMLAAGRGRLAVVQMLVEHGANRELKNKDGDTALACAEKNKHTATAEWLRALDAPTPRARSRSTPTSTLAPTPTPTTPTLEPEVSPRGPGLELAMLTNEPTQAEADDTSAAEADADAGGLIASTLAVFEAVEGGSSDLVAQLGVESVNARGPRDRTPVHRAVELGRLDVLRVLIEKGASVTSHDDTGATPLHVACDCGQTYAASFLVMRGADVRAVDNDGRTPIEVAAMRGHIDMVTELAQRGVDLTVVSPSGRTLLHHAVTGNSTAMVAFLLEPDQERGVDINAVDACGWSALHCAVRSGNLPVVALLLEHGADPNLRTSDGPFDPTASSARIVRRSESALHAAVRLGRVDIVALLIGCVRTHINARNAQQETPLMLAASLGRSEIVAVIVHANSQTYHEWCVALTNDHDATPTLPQLHELVVLITSVYDLRWMLTLSAMCSDVSADDMTTLLKAALLHVIANKLVFDDDACVFFKMTLKHCEKEGLLPLTDILLLDRQAEKVNTESAEWATALKKQVAANTWRLDAHDICLRSVVDGVKEVHSMVLANRAAVTATTNRVASLQVQVSSGKQLLQQLAVYADRTSIQMDQFERRLCQSEDNIGKVALTLQSFRDAYVGHLEQEQRNKKLKMVCGAVACVAGFVFAPVLKEIADAVVDLANPIEIVKQIYGEDDIASFLAEQSQSVLPEVIRGQLDKYAITPEEFETLLREEIALQHPEIIQECATRGIPVAVDGGQADVARTNTPLLETEEGVVSQVILELRTALNEIAADDTARRMGVSQASVAQEERPAQASRVSSIYSRTSSMMGLPTSVGPEIQKPPLAKPDERAMSRNRIMPSRYTRSPSVRSMASSVGPDESFQLEERCSFESSSPSIADSSFDAIGGSGNVILLSDPSAFPYHSAVQECLGDVTTFQELIKTVDNNVDANAKMEMIMVVTTTTREALCAAQYAYLLGFSAVGDAVGARMNNAPDFDEAPVKSIALEEDMDDFPFVLAVAESGGDVDECEDCMDALDEDEHALDDQIQAVVVRESSYSVSWTVYEYACHLGFVDLVKYLFKEVCSSVPAKTRIHAIKQARERAKAVREQA